MKKIILFIFIITLLLNIQSTSLTLDVPNHYVDFEDSGDIEFVEV